MSLAATLQVIGIVGAGTMGRGIAQWAAEAGHHVLLHDADPVALERAAEMIAADLDRRVERGKVASAAPVMAHITFSPDLDSLAGAGLVIEAIVEDLAIKAELFARIETLVSDRCVLATNTSSLSVTALARGLKQPGRLAGLHFFNPVPAMRLVEVVRSPWTSNEVLEGLLQLCRASGHVPVVARDMPGFIVNHAGRAFGLEGLRILSEGIAPAEVIDQILRETAGFRMGPLQLFDLIGLDVSQRVMHSIYDQFLQEPRFRPVPLVAERVTAGLLGRKSGMGFYDYSVGGPTPAAGSDDVSAASTPGPTELCIRGDDSPRDLSGRLAALLDAAGIAWSGPDTASDNAVILVAPLGTDATSTALALGSDPARTVAVDMLLPDAPRLTIMGSLAIQPQALAAARTVIEAAGRQVSVIHDSPGFVTQRVLAQIVSVATEIAGQQIATPADIDLAAQLGLGYPFGPFELGDRLGPARLLAVLEALHRFYNDSCYRPGPWLSRRARLGLSLTILPPELG